MNEELFRLSILNALQEGNSIDDFLDNHTIGYLRAYETRKMESFLPHYHAPSFANSKLSDQLMDLTIEWAQSLNSEVELEKLFLEVYASRNAELAWQLLKENQFPNLKLQETFNELLTSSSENSSYFILGAGGFSELKSNLFKPQVSFGYLKTKGRKYESYNIGYRFGGGEDKIRVDLGPESTNISSSSIFLSYELGIKVSESFLDHYVYGTVAHSTYLSEYGLQEGDSKRIISSFGFGLGYSAYLDLKPGRFGFDVQYHPFNIETNKDVNLEIATLSFGIRYLFFNSREAEEFLRPIGYYKN